MSTLQWTPKMVEANARKVKAGEAKARAIREAARHQKGVPIDIKEMARRCGSGVKTVFRKYASICDYSHSPHEPAVAALTPKPTTDSGKGQKFTIFGHPMGKPRMTQRDKWAKRPCVMRYRAWCDAARVEIPPLTSNASRVDWVAFIGIPKSWSVKKKAAHKGKPHRAKPDRDNIDKAILDLLFKDDSGICEGIISKRWDDGAGPRIEIEVI